MVGKDGDTGVGDDGAGGDAGGGEISAGGDAGGGEIGAVGSKFDTVNVEGVTDSTAVRLAPASTSSTDLGWNITPGISEGVGEGGLLFREKNKLLRVVRGCRIRLRGHTVGPLMLARRAAVGGSW